MKVHFWGVRGSIPVPGPDTVRYGGNTTCVEVRLDDGGTIILDAGTGIRMLGTQLMRAGQADEISIAITHPHWDHIQGFPFFGPAYSPKTRIRFYGYPPAWGKLKKILSNQMDSMYFPVDFHDLNAQIDFMEVRGGHFRIGSATFDLLRNNHPGTCHSFRIEADGSVLVFMTDNELDPPDRVTPYEKFVDFAQGADMLIHDSQYTDEELPIFKSYGHSSYNQSLQLAHDAGVKELVVFHHDPGRNDDQMDEIVAKAKDQAQQHMPELTVSVAREGETLAVGR